MTASSSSALEWRDTKVLITGGASLLGAHLTDALVGLGAEVRVVDNLSCGRFANIEAQWMAHRIEYFEADLRRQEVAEGAVEGMEVVFHLASERSDLEYRQRALAGLDTLLIDSLVIDACRRQRVRKMIYASILPAGQDTSSPVAAGKDDLWTTAKRSGERAIRAAGGAGSMEAAICRYGNVYGPRGSEHEPLMALIANRCHRREISHALETPTMSFDWTFVSDALAATLLAAEQANVDEPVPIQSGVWVSLQEAARLVDECEVDPSGHTDDALLGPTAGPVDLHDWAPLVDLEEGIRRTACWYAAHRKEAEVTRYLADTQGELG